MSRFTRRAWTRIAGVAWLILATLHVPLPQPDYHSLRHHDRCDGEICARHNHLLRWHSGNASGDEQAVFHWHWVWPGKGGAETGFDPDPAGHAGLHADSDDWQEPSLQLTPPFPLERARSTASAFEPPTLDQDWVPPTRGSILLPDPRQRLGPYLRAPVARRANFSSLLQRWDC